MTIFMKLLSGNGLLQQKLAKCLLRCPHARAQLDGESNLNQHMLQGANHGDRVEIVVKTEMRYPEEPALHFTLAIGNHRPKAMPEKLYDIARINPVRRGDCSECRCRGIP